MIFLRGRANRLPRGHDSLVVGGDADGFSSSVIPGEDGDELTLRDLLTEVANQSPSAFEALYRMIATKVYGFLRLRLSSEQDLQEVLQDTFLVVWRRAGEFQRQSGVLTWVLGIARHKCLDKLRNQRRDAVRSMSLDEYVTAGHWGNVDFVPQMVERLTLDSAILRLPPASQELLYLVFVQKLSYPEVSALLDIPQGTVKSRVYQLRGQLRELLREGEVRDG